MRIGRTSRILAIATMLCAGACASTPAGVRPAPFPGAAVPAAIPGGAPRPSATISTLLARALALRGVRYRSGGSTPSTGFDCSGFVQYVFAESHVSLPRTVAEQFHAGAHVSARHVEPGDLVFFDTEGTGPSHVGIALDATTFIHAPGSGRVVRVERFDTPYWRSRFLGARREEAETSSQP